MKISKFQDFISILKIFKKIRLIHTSDSQI